MSPRAWRLEEPWVAILLLVDVFAWSLLFFRHSTWSLPGMCSVVTLPGFALYGSLQLMRNLNPPVSLTLDWGVMGFAMTAPLLLVPVQYVGERSFVRRRAAEIILFALPYLAIWFLAGVALLPLALILKSLLSGSMVCIVTLAIAIGWQFSSAKQRCLNLCHRRPTLAAAGWVANRDALTFGLTIGAACLGACWAMMLAALCMPHGHVIAMFVVTLFAACERLEIPGAPVWRWHGAGKAMRIATFRVHLLFRTWCPLESWLLYLPLKCRRD